ncbi:ATP-binding cassette domain-containing protein [Candidatus Bathyarchaeota archaeon]|nr:MAG: ATP-binding cassette domain-containing protein [Candidatus Bathyarchaeota archaeon]
MNPLIECRSVAVEYPTADGVLKLYGDGLSLIIEEGAFVSVVGGSGWGKSTLVNLILGLEKPTRGNIYIRGENVTQRSFVSRCSRIKTAAVFQRPTAVPHLTVLQNLHLALSMIGIPRRERDERIRESMALAVRPEFLVLDEPTGDLDTSIANLVMPLLRGLNRDHGITILMTTAIPRHASSARHQVHLRGPTIVARTPRVLARGENV